MISEAIRVEPFFAGRISGDSVKQQHPRTADVEGAVLLRELPPVRSVKLQTRLPVHIQDTFSKCGSVTVSWTTSSLGHSFCLHESMI